MFFDTGTGQQFNLYGLNMLNYWIGPINVCIRFAPYFSLCIQFLCTLKVIMRVVAFMWKNVPVKLSASLSESK